MTDQIRIGIVGGGRGWMFAGLFSDFPESRVTAIAERIPARLAAVGDTCPEARRFTDYEEMLSEADIDAVVVASDPPSHAPQVAMALAAGKHVLSEVPASFTAAGHFQVLEAARPDRIYMLAENACYWGCVQDWQRMHEAGELGAISYGEAEYLHDMRGSHYSDAEGKRRAHDEAGQPGVTRNWRAQLHPILYLTHSLGPLLWVTDDRCVGVSCQATPANGDPECGSPDLEAALFRTAAGRALRVVCGFNTTHPTGHRVALFGSEATVVWRRSQRDEAEMRRATDDPRTWTAMPWAMEWEGAPEEARAARHGTAGWLIARRFLEAVLAGEQPALDVHRGMDISFPGVCAAISAERGGEFVPIPDTRQPAEVAAWRAQGYNEPWPFGSPWRAVRGGSGEGTA
jgi:predicted dehydrogenase